MTVTKTAISMDADLLAEVRAAVERGEAASVSAYLSHAARRFQQEESLGEMLAETFAATGGPPTEDERRRAREALGAA